MIRYVSTTCVVAERKGGGFDATDATNEVRHRQVAALLHQ